MAAVLFSVCCVRPTTHALPFRSSVFVVPLLPPQFPPSFPSLSTPFALSPRFTPSFDLPLFVFPSVFPEIFCLSPKSVQLVFFLPRCCNTTDIPDQAEFKITSTRYLPNKPNRLRLARHRRFVLDRSNKSSLCLIFPGLVGSHPGKKSLLRYRISSVVSATCSFN